jgi:mono/diheme cytochrome c family protein
MRRWLATLLIALVGGLFAGCRGEISEDPPRHPNPNMDSQERYDAQEANPFFADGRASRQPVAGTVAQGELALDRALNEGVDGNGVYLWTSPVETSSALLERGRERFDIYCMPCHGAAGDGQGIVATQYEGLVPPPSFGEDRLREMADGEVYSVIANGVRTMPSYRHQLTVADRWAVVAYLRALQRSQRTTPDDVPPAELGRMEVRP